MTKMPVFQKYRIEQDLIGERRVPFKAYYGIHTLRALENFHISSEPLHKFPAIIIAHMDIKQAAALANRDLGLLDDIRCKAIVAACCAIRSGELFDQFPIDLIQGGAGTSTNMNANEVICNKALEILGRPRGDYDFLHPNEHINMCQSTNDVYPTALKIAMFRTGLLLQKEIGTLQRAFEAKAVEFKNMLKVGRTQLQDAVPMTLGQEFHTYAAMLYECQERLEETSQLLCKMNLGATAIGTQINTPLEYPVRVRDHLCVITGLDLTTAPNLIAATQDVGAFVQLSGVLRQIALKLSKICNDLRLLSSGPTAGFGEINLPPVQAGSSIMPGKINPVIPEVVNQVAFEVIGSDVTVSFAAEAGQLQLNAFEPVIGYSIFRSMTHLTNACKALTEKCVNGITANPVRMLELVNRSIILVTALNPFIGYRSSTLIAKEALASGRKVTDIVIERGLLSKDELAQLLALDTLTGPDEARLV